MATRMKAPTHLSTFEVDKAGLAKLLERRGKEFVVAELVQNAWDEDTSVVDVRLSKRAAGYYTIRVEDDNPEGFADLTHAYTLFAESAKKTDPTKRGRFNLGEKLVIAICAVAEVSTTKGRIRFTEKGREMLDAERASGSVFTGQLKMTDDEAEAARRLIFSLIVPDGINTYFNDELVPQREGVASFIESLRTEKADDDGNLRPTQRRTNVEVFEPLGGETAMLYELGIPVVETGDRWHVNVGQKVPLNTDRDNVPPYYLRDIRASVLNHTAEMIIGQEAASERWVTDAISDERAEPDAVRQVIKERFGEKAVIADPTDREGERIAVSKGYTVVTGGSLPKAAWEQVRAADALLPAGKVTPSPNPNIGDENINVMKVDHWPQPVREIADYAKVMASEVLGDGADFDLKVRIANSPQWRFAATYGRHGDQAGELTLNLGTLGYRWFEQGVTDRVHELLIHEFAHHFASNHLSREFYDACCLVGARLARSYAHGRLRELAAPLAEGVAARGEVG